MDSILTKSEFFFHTNEKGKKPFIIYEYIYYGEDNAKIDYTKLMEIKKYYLENKGNNSYDNFKAFFVYLEKVEGEIEKEFKYNYCLYIKMNFKKEMKNNNKNKKDKDYNDYDNDNLYSISCEFTFDNPINGNKMRYKDENILNEKTNAKNNGFIYMLFNINSEVFKDIKYKKIILDKKELSINSFSKLNDKESSINYLSTKSNTKIKGVKIIENYNESEEYEEELSNGIIIESNASNDNIINYVQDIILIVANNGTRLINLNLNYFGFSRNLNKLYDNDFFVKNIILMKKGTLIFCSENGIIIYNNSYLTNKPELTIIKKNPSYKGGIRINENLVALTSNKILPKGKDKLIIYNINTKKKIIDIKNYSFTLSQNNLSLINIPESFEKYYENKKLIICACKQYLSSQKNGILLAVLDLDNNEIYSKFYHTKTFEVYCFCQIISNNNNNDNNNIISENNKDKVKNNYTEYILVGGFAPYNSKLIKLYKINFNENIEKCEIEFIRDIIIKKKGDFKGFKGAIKSITQSRENGNILITCDDKNAYLFPQEELFEIKNNNIY